MPIIPIRFIHQSDKGTIPNNLLDLSTIYRHNFPLASELFVTEPDELFKKACDKLQITDSISMDANLDKLHSILRDQVEAEFREVVENHGLNASQAWEKVINTWVLQLRQRLLVETLSSNKLKAVPCLRNDLIHASGTGYFDKKSKEIVLDICEGSLSIDSESELVVLIQNLDKLFIPTRIFHWILTDQFRILDCQILTEKNPEKSTHYIQTEIQDGPTSPHTKKTVNKVYAFKSQDNLVLPENIDGLVLSHINDSEVRLFQILEYSKSLSPKKVIYQINSSINTQELSDLEFLKKQKKLENLQVQITDFVAEEEVNVLIKKLAGTGINKHNILLNCQTPENILNLEKYLDVGVNNITIDLDSLLVKLTGQVIIDFSESFYITTLIKFLDPYKKILFDHKIILYLRGNICLNDDLVQFFINQRIVTFVVSEGEVGSLRDYLSFLEKRLIDKKLAKFE